MLESKTLLAALALSIVLIFVCPPANAGVSFAKPISMAVVSAGGVAFGDFNEDGKSDIVAWADSNWLEVAFGDGEGKFHSPAIYSTFSGTGFVITADFNGDGHLDLAVLSNGYICLLLGNGRGIFQAPIMSSVQVTGTQIAAGDFNGDGILDLAMSSFCLDRNCLTFGGYTILLGNGDGTFDALPSVQVPDESAETVVVEDFNGDGKLDLAMSGNALLVTALGDGDGTFQPVITYHLDYSGSISLATADFNGDGHPDLATVCYRPSFGLAAVEVRLGNADGAFEPPLSSPAPNGSSLRAADFDQDGNVDVVVNDGLGTTVNVLLGNGDGTLRRAVPFGIGHPNPHSVNVADLNGDGKADVITVELGGPYGTFASVLLNTSTQP